MRHTGVLIALCLLAAGLAGCSDRTPLREYVAFPGTEFDCDSGGDDYLGDLFSDGDYDVTCSRIEVPESRSGRSDATIQVAAAVYHSRSDEPLPDPVVYLSGGPGGPAIEDAFWMMDMGLDDLLEERDIVFIDQRGTGLSRPALNCESADAAEEGAAHYLPSSPEYREIQERAVEECRDELVAEGIDLGSYNTDENAADISDILYSLGYREWNLYGISYGTRLAQAVMRDDPGPVRSVILDSTVPLDVRYTGDTTESFLNAFNTMAAACEADDECSADYPDLRADLLKSFEALDREPFEAASSFAFLTDEDSDETILVDGRRYYDLLFLAFYDASMVSQLPGSIAAVADGDYGFIDLYASFANMAFGSMARGMHISVVCSEDVPFADFEQPEGADEFEHYVYAMDDDGDDYEAMCEAWDVPPLEQDSLEALESGIPTLVLAGSLDPITPPAYGERAAKGLKNSYLFEFADASHGVLGSSCANRLVRMFIGDPEEEPSHSCTRYLDDPIEFIEPFDFDEDLLDSFDEGFADAECYGYRFEECLDTNPDLAALVEDPAVCQGDEANLCLVPLGFVRRDVVEEIVAFHRQSGIEVHVLESVPLTATGEDRELSQVASEDAYEQMASAYGITHTTQSTYIGISAIDMRPANGEYGWWFGHREGEFQYSLNHGVFSYFRMANVEPYDGASFNDRLLFERATKYFGRYVALLYLDFDMGDDIDYLNFREMSGISYLDEIGDLWPEGNGACAGNAAVICLVPDNDYQAPSFEADLEAAVEKLNEVLPDAVEIRYPQGGSASYRPSLDDWGQEFADDLRVTVSLLLAPPGRTVIGVTDDAISQASSVPARLDTVFAAEQLATVSTAGVEGNSREERVELMFRVLLRTILVTRYGYAFNDDPGSLLWSQATTPEDLRGTSLPPTP